MIVKQLNERFINYDKCRFAVQVLHLFSSGQDDVIVFYFNLCYSI